MYSKEYMREYMREYREKNKDKLREIRKKYYQNHKEQHKEYMKKYSEKNKDKIKEIRRNYYINNKDKIYQQQREWQKENAEKFSKLCSDSRKRRVEKLREQGVKNAWDVVNYGKEPKYEVKKLYELPEKQNIKLYIEDKIIIFDHIDGFYSYCWLEEDRNKLVHIKATALFKKHKDGYKYIEE